MKTQQKAWDKFPNLRPFISADAEDVSIDFRGGFEERKVRAGVEY